MEYVNEELHLSIRHGCVLTFLVAERVGQFLEGVDGLLGGTLGLDGHHEAVGGHGAWETPGALLLVLEARLGHRRHQVVQTLGDCVHETLVISQPRTKKQMIYIMKNEIKLCATYW